MHVLIIENDIPLATRIGDTIEAAGDEPDYADDEALAQRLCQINRYDVIVLGQHIPRYSYRYTCQTLADLSGRRAPVLVLDRKTGMQYRDYGPHAFACPSTPALELHQLIKRLRQECACTQSQLSAGELHMDLEARKVYYGQVPVELAPISFHILELLLRAFPGVVTRDHIEKQIWEDNPPESDAALRGHIHRLRQLLERPTACKMIRTVHGVGYQLEPA